MELKTRAIRIMCGLLVAGAAASCDVHEFPEPPQPGMLRLSLDFDTGIPLHQTVEVTRADAKAAEEYDLRYTVGVFALDATKATDRQELARVTVTREATDNPDQVIDMPLDAGDYRLVVWTDYVDAGSTHDKYYDTSDFGEIRLAEGRHTGNTPYRDAFRGTIDVRIAEGETRELHVGMERPLTRYEFVTTDLDEFLTRALAAAAREAEAAAAANGDTPAELSDETRAVDLGAYRVVVRYPGFMPSSFNLFTDKPADSSTGVSFESAITPTSDSEATLGFDYVFINGTESTVQAAVDIYDEEGVRISGTNTIDIPVVRGKRTIVRGEFLTSTAAGSIGIVPDFDGEFNVEIR